MISYFLRGDCVDGCGQKFYDAIYECFGLYVSKYIVEDYTVEYAWFDRALHNVVNNRTKAHKQAVFGNLGATLRVFTV
jgi:hypothetical protein